MTGRYPFDPVALLRSMRPGERRRVNGWLVIRHPAPPAAAPALDRIRTHAEIRAHLPLLHPIRPSNNDPRRVDDVEPHAPDSTGTHRPADPVGTTPAPTCDNTARA